jgi:hypothetical protein
MNETVAIKKEAMVNEEDRVNRINEIINNSEKKIFRELMDLRLNSSPDRWFDLFANEVCKIQYISYFVSGLIIQWRCFLLFGLIKCSNCLHIWRKDSLKVRREVTDEMNDGQDF